MAFTWEALYNFFTPPASRNPSPESSPSFLSSAFTSLRSGETPSSTKQHTDLPMPPTSAFFGRGAGGAGAPASPASPADSSTSISAGSETDFFPPQTVTTTTSTSPYTHRSPSLSSTSTNTTSDLERPLPQQRTHTTPPTVAATLAPEQPQRPAGPRRSATNIVAPEPLSRDFPAPSGDADASLEELLARPPPRWSLGHYVKHARVRPAAAADGDGDAVVAGGLGGRNAALEEAKRELLRAKREVDFVVASRGL